MNRHGVVFWTVAGATAIILTFWLLSMLERGGYYP